MNPQHPTIGTFRLVNFTSLSLLFLVIFFFSTFSLSIKAQTNSITSILHKHGEVIVRVNFNDPKAARQFGLGLEPMQSNYEKGYLVFHVAQEEFDNLQAAINGTDMTIELDVELSEKYITNQQPSYRKHQRV